MLTLFMVICFNLIMVLYPFHSLTQVGSVLDGICGSISFGTLVADKFEDWWRGYKVTYVTDQRQILNLSLDYFGIDPNDFGDEEMVNMDTVTFRYKERCKV